MLSYQAELDNLKSALKRIAMVRDWCGITQLPNVRSDMQKAIKEIESVVYSVDERRKIAEKQNDRPD